MVSAQRNFMFAKEEDPSASSSALFGVVEDATAAGCCGGGGSGGVGSIFGEIGGKRSRKSVGGGSGNGSRSLATDEWDAALAKEMNELSVTEREKVLDDIHGVASIQEETPASILQSLREIDLALGVLPKIKRKALDRALFFKPGLLDDEHSDKFKLMFLRADSYDAPKAAKRLAKHFEEKLELFGEGKLTKPITLDDLEEEDLENLGFVGCAILPHKDQSGRPIMFFDIPRFNFDNPQSMFRCNWYQIMSALQDDEAQLKGFCDVVYCPGNILDAPSSFNKFSKVARRNGKMIEGLPFRISTFHFCYDEPRVKFVITALGNAFGKQIRLRIRTHYGSPVEIQYSMMTFGIVCHYLFTQNSPEKTLFLHDQRIQKCGAIEQEHDARRLQEETSTGRIPHPQSNDVLVGRGRPYQDYPGNQRLGSLVEAQLKRYTSTSDKFEKTCIILEVVKAVRDSGGRFIQKVPESEGCWWKVATDKAAREKTCSAFRNKMGKSGSAARAKESNTGQKHPVNEDTLGDLIDSNETAAKTIDSRNAKRLRIDPSFVSSSS